MIVNEPLGLHEYDETQPFGCPYHGLVEGGKLTLPTGEKIDYPQPGGVQQAGRTLLIQPTWALGGTASQSQINKGLHWGKYAILGGENAVLHGTALGEGCWLWAEAPGKVWKVDASGLLTGDPTAQEGTTIGIQLTRFGWLGELPADEERERTISVVFPTLQHSGTNDYDNMPYTYNNDFPRKCLLADTHPQDGHRALFSIVLDWSLDDGIATIAVLELNLQAALISVLADGSSNGSMPNGSQPTQFNAVPATMQDNVVLVETSRTDCGGGYELTYEYKIQGQIPIPDVYNADYIDTYVYLLGAGYDQAGTARVIQAKTTQHMTANYWNVHTFGGRRIVNNCVPFEDDNSYHSIEYYGIRSVEVRLELITIDEQILFSRSAQSTSNYYSKDDYYGVTRLISTKAIGLDGEPWPYSITLSPFSGTTNYGLWTNVYGTILNPAALMSESFQVRGLVALAPNSFAYVMADKSAFNNNDSDPGFSTMTVKSIFNAAGLGGDLATQVSASYFQGFASIHPITGERFFNNQADGPCCFV